jgi:acyl-CoA thioester hydrolase
MPPSLLSYRRGVAVDDPAAERRPTFVGVAYPHQVDHMGHLNVRGYAEMFDQASWTFYLRLGLSAQRMQAESCGMALLVQHNEYDQEVFAGVAVEVDTELLEVANKVLRFRHRMTRRDDGSLVATSEVVAAFFNRVERRAAPLPEDVRAAALRELEPDRAARGVRHAGDAAPV